MIYPILVYFCIRANNNLWTPKDYTEEFQRGLRNYKSTKALPLYGSEFMSAHPSLLQPVLKQDNSDLLPPMPADNMRRYSTIAPHKAPASASAASSVNQGLLGQKSASGRVLKIMRDTKKVTERDIELNRIYNPLNKI